MKTSCIARVFAGLHQPAAASPPIPLQQQGIRPGPHQLGGCLHTDVVHHTEIERTQTIKTLPLLHQRVIDVDQEGVIELLPELLFQGAKAGEIDDEPTAVQRSCSEMDRE